MPFYRLHQVNRRYHISIAFSLIAALPVGVIGQDKYHAADSAQEAIDAADEPRVEAAQGEIVSEMSKSLLYVFQAKNNDYWFGSDNRGVYRYDGNTIFNFTANDGLVSNQIRGIQEDTAGNIFFTTYAGVSKFDGQRFTTLGVSTNSLVTNWKLRPDDLWFVGPPEAGVVYRYDGQSLHRLKFPKTKLGDEHYAKIPRSKFPNARYSPYDVYSILKDSKGTLWFGTSGVGVCRYDGKEFHWFTDKLLVDAPVRSVFEDRGGNFWISYSGGSSFDGFRPVDEFGKSVNGVKGTIVAGMSIAEDSDGKIWTANYSSGATRYDGEKEVRYPITEGNATITTFSIYRDNQGVLWLGTHNGGAYKFNGTAFEKFRP